MTDELLRLLNDEAQRTDAEGKWPERSMKELADAGLLGLTLPRDTGGSGEGMRKFAEVTEQIAGRCASTAMVYLMHTCGAQTIATSTSPRRDDLLRTMSAGKAVATLAFSEKGSRSHFWAPVSRATQNSRGVVLNCDKSFVTSAGHADYYVVSSLAVDAKGPVESTLYLVEKNAQGFDCRTAWNGIGLRGNASSPISIRDCHVAEDARLTPEGEGFKSMMETVLPWFQIGSAAVSIGIAEASFGAAAAHAGSTKLEHLKESLAAAVPGVRARLAQMRIAIDSARGYLDQTLSRIEKGSPDVMLFVLGSKAGAAEMALRVTDDAMRVCGGAAFSRGMTIERNFRDARAASIMAPTTDVLYDFIGKAVTGLPLFRASRVSGGGGQVSDTIKVGVVAYDPKVVTIWEGIKDYFGARGVAMDFVLFSTYDAQVDALMDGWIEIAWNTNLAYVKVHRLTHGKCGVLAMRDVDVGFTTKIIAGAKTGIQGIPDLKGKRFALGSRDSGQAAILPAYFLKQHGIDPAKDMTTIRFDLDVGKHGDTGTSEVEVLNAVAAGETDAGAIGDQYWARALTENLVDNAKVRAIWTSPEYCHCNFTVREKADEQRFARWTDALLAMDYNKPAERKILEMEGLKRWVRPQLDGYRALFDAVDELHFFNN